MTSTGHMAAALGVALAAVVGAEARGAGGTVVVKSDPPGASVYLDDETKPRGVTPLEIKRVPSGLHKVRVMLAGFPEKRKGFCLQS